jgi:hypothetical protein
VGTQHLCPAFRSRGRLPGLAGVTTRPARSPAVERQLHLPTANFEGVAGGWGVQVSTAFCQANDLDEGEMVPKLVRVIQGKMRALGMPVYINHFLTRNALLGE